MAAAAFSVCLCCLPERHSHLKRAPPPPTPNQQHNQYHQAPSLDFFPRLAAPNPLFRGSSMPACRNLSANFAGSMALRGIPPVAHLVPSFRDMSSPPLGSQMDSFRSTSQRLLPPGLQALQALNDDEERWVCPMRLLRVTANHRAKLSSW